MAKTKTDPLKIEFWDIDKLLDYPKNAKKHSNDQIARLARLIAKFGVVPLQIEGNQPGCTPGMIITGHGRKLSLIALGRVKAPVYVRSDLTKGECDALRIADNAVVSTEMNYDILAEETIRLTAEGGFEMEDFGLTDAEIKAISTDIGEIDDSAFTTDIPAAVEGQKTKNTAKEAEIDREETPVTKALGFSKITTEQGRAIRGFMAKIEAKTSLSGAAAFVAHITSQE